MQDMEWTEMARRGGPAAPVNVRVKSDAVNAGVLAVHDS